MEAAVRTRAYVESFSLGKTDLSGIWATKEDVCSQEDGTPCKAGIHCSLAVVQWNWIYLFIPGPLPFGYNRGLKLHRTVTHLPNVFSRAHHNESPTFRSHQSTWELSSRWDGSLVSWWNLGTVGHLLLCNLLIAARLSCSACINKVLHVATKGGRVSDWRWFAFISPPVDCLAIHWAAGSECATCFSCASKSHLNACQQSGVVIVD